MIVPPAADGDDLPKVIGRLDLNPEARHARYIVVAGSIIGLMLAGTLVYALFIRDGWERQHRDRILSLKAAADGLVRAKKHEQAKAKFDELRALVGEHRIRDRSLNAELEVARVSASENEKQLAAIAAARAEAERRQQAIQPGVPDPATTAYDLSLRTSGPSTAEPNNAVMDFYNATGRLPTYDEYQTYRILKPAFDEQAEEDRKMQDMIKALQAK